MIEDCMKIRQIVNTWESLDKEEFIMDLLIMLGDDKVRDVLDRLKNQRTMFGD